MQPTTSKLLLATLVALAPTHAQEPEREPPLFPQPQGSMRISVSNEGLDHAELVRSFAQATGLNIVVGHAVAEQLRQLPVALIDDLELPPDQVYPVVESMLVAAGFCLSEIGNGAPHVYMLIPTASSSRTPTMSKARLVDAEDIHRYRDHPAVLVRTALTLTIDARQLTNALRSLLVDPNLQSAVPLGDTNTLVLTGLGREVAELCDVLRRADAAHVEALAESARQRAEAGAVEEAEGAAEDE